MNSPTNLNVASLVRGSIAAGILFASAVPLAVASSHSDAPQIKQDPQANLTDVYAFIGTRYDDPTQQVLNVIANVRPFSEPGDGPHYERFADDARYSLHITDPMSGETVMRYDFLFSDVDGGYKNPKSILSNGLGDEVGPIMTIGDARQNFTQSYRVELESGSEVELIASGLQVAVPNAGGNVTPLYNDETGRAVSGAQSLQELDSYTTQAISDGDNGVVLFAGPRDDSFYADIPGVFDLLNVRILDNNGSLDDGLGQDGDGVDGFKGFNVLTIGMQIPLQSLPEFQYQDAFFGLQTGVGVYASVSRPQTTVRNADGSVSNTGPWIQVNRLGNPLFNEGLVAFRDKLAFNTSSPTGDSAFAKHASDPELARLINFVFQTDFVTTRRDDLVRIFIPDVLRVATTTGPVPLDGQIGFSRFGFVGGDTTGGVSSGWPNGRRFGDDVVDIALTAIASGPSYQSITVVGDNVGSNDIPFNAVFPYAATPHSGSFNRKDPAPTDTEKLDINADGLVNVKDLRTFIRLFKDRSR
ncbi:MAG: DUF4331 domain-containing protein [Phycisphaerales bacterium]